MNRSQLTRYIQALVLSSLFLSAGLVLPFVTGQIPQVGNMLLPMHLPVLLCGFVCGPFWGAAVGFSVPLLRGVLFGMPPIFPAGIAMAFELCTYGLISGLLRRKSRESLGWLYGSLILAMIAGRLVWGAAQVVILGLGDTPFTWAAFWAGAVANAIPGIIVQLILIPLLVVALRKAKLAD